MAAMGARAHPHDRPPSRVVAVLVAVAGLLATFALAACGTDLGSGDDTNAETTVAATHAHARASR